MGKVLEGRKVPSRRFILPIEVVGGSEEAVSIDRGQPSFYIGDGAKWEMEQKRVVHVVIDGDSEIGFTATTPDLPGCISEGENIDDAYEHFHEALLALLESYEKGNEEVPWEQGKLPALENGRSIRLLAVE